MVKLSELRRVEKEQEPQMFKNYPFEQLKKYKNDLNVYISFTMLPKLGLNPESKYCTPLGIYSYPLNMGWDFYNINRKGIGGFPFASDCPYIYVFKPNSPVTKIEDLFDANNAKTKEIIEQANKLRIAPELYDADSPEDANIKCFGYNYIRGLAKRNPVKWNKVFKSFNIYGIIDSGFGVIYPDEPCQAVFFKASDLKVLDVINNKIPDSIKTSRIDMLGRRTKEELEQMLWKDPSLLRLVSTNDARISKDFIKEFLTINPKEIIRLIDFSKCTSDIIKEVITKVPGIVYNIRNNPKCTSDIISLGISHKPCILALFKNDRRINKKIILDTLNRDSTLLVDIINNSNVTLDVILTVIKKNPEIANAIEDNPKFVELIKKIPELKDWLISKNVKIGV